MTPELNQEQKGVETAPQTDAESTRPSPGMLIRRARERAHLTPEALSAQLKLARGTLEALERDDFNVLVEPVYVRGYYRKCAKLLGIAEKDLMDAYQGRVAPRVLVAPSKLRLASGTELGSGSRLPVALAILAAVVAVVVISLIWFARGETNRVPPAVAAKVEAMTPEDDKAESADTAAAATAGESITTASTTAGSSGQAPVASQPQRSVPAAVPSAATPATQSAPPVPVAATSKPAVAASTAVLLMNFSITSWARVDDASGKTLLNGLVRAGEKQELRGGAPFTVFLGNAPGVSVELNGKPEDLSKYIAGNKTARFTLPATP